MHKKRGQATILILLGLVVVGLVAGAYFTKDYVLKSKLERMSEKSLVVPKQAESVRDYIMSCVKQVSDEGVKLAGQRGGYIDMPGDPIPLSVHNKFSNSLEVLPGFRVPYWYYNQANNVDKIQILSLDEISKNIQNYIDENLRLCVRTFDMFKYEGYKINSGLIKTVVEIQNDKVLFEIKFPVHIEKADFKFDFEEFYYKTEEPLGELYSVAEGIFNYENGKHFLEKKTMDMMVGYEEIPLNGESLDCTAPIWDKHKVIEYFKHGLAVNIPALKIKDSNYILSDTSRKYYEVDIGSVSKDLSINFMYSGRWPFQLEVEPEDNGILKGESVSSSLGSLRGLVESFVCLSSWHFVYNVKYPVLVILDKDDYVFQYAMMVVIDRNEPRKNVIKPLDLPEVDTRYCDNKQFNIEVSVYDENGNPVNDADISYLCINHLCELGKSSGNVYTGLVMPCGNGFAIANKEGYHSGRMQLSTLGDSFVSVRMKKYQDVDTNVEILRAGSGNLKEDETVYISLMNEEEDYGTSIVYPETNKIKLISGNYKVSMYMVKDTDDKIMIPGKEVEHCVDIPKKGFTGIFGATETKCITTEIPSMELDRVITGAAEFGMSISKADIDKGKIIFYVPYQGIPTSVDELSKLSREVDENFRYPRFD